MASEFAARFRAWWAATLAKLRRPRWWLPLVALFVLKAFAADTTVKVVRAVGIYFGDFLSAIINGPLGITGLAFFALLAILVVRAYRETIPQAKAKAVLERKLELAKAEADVAKAREGLLNTKLELASTKLQAAQRTIEEQAAALANSDSLRGALYERLNYGDALIKPTPLDPANFAVMFARVEEMKPNLSAMLTDVNGTWHHVRSQISEDTPAEWLFDPVNDEAVMPTNRAYKLFDECLATKQDPRPALALLYCRYCDWRVWILRYVRLLNQVLYEVPTYSVWLKHDTQFFRDLQQRCATSLFAEVRDALRAYNDRFGVQKPLPDPSRDP
jgi:hypothetical protein